MQTITRIHGVSSTGMVHLVYIDTLNGRVEVACGASQAGFKGKTERPVTCSRCQSSRPIWADR